MPSTSTVDLDFDRYLIPFRARRLPLFHFDVVVLGGGAAGATAALSAADAGAEVAMLSKAGLEESNTVYAQGGVAAVLDPGDSIESHLADTMRVGCGLSERRVVEEVVRGGPRAIARLVELGAAFDKDARGGLDLSREGGHSHRRIAHAHGASTGLEIQRTLSSSVAAHAGIASFADTFAIDLLTQGELEDRRIVGVLCRSERGELVVFSADQVILATGGSGQTYRETTNPSIATGDGVAMALRAGARLRDLEFFQFHPTCLYIAGAARVLISEIVRGAGGLLLDKDGVRFMPEYHPSAELAPRDVVSRACFDRMVKTGDTNVYLDLSDLERDPHELFPGISRICSMFSIDIARDPLPVRPGAHYQIGGVEVDLDASTSVHGLRAVGECASTGLHGANRMGSNSLLEGLVLGARAGIAAAGSSEGATAGSAARVTNTSTRSREDAGVRLSIDDMTYSLKSLMWRQMGIERFGADMSEAIERIDFWRRAIDRLAPPEPRAWELANMLSVARLSTASALARQESRGTHHRSDFPATHPGTPYHTRITPRVEGDKLPSATLEHVPLGGAQAAPRLPATEPRSSATPSPAR